MPGMSLRSPNCEVRDLLLNRAMTTPEPLFDESFLCGGTHDVCTEDPRDWPGPLHIHWGVGRLVGKLVHTAGDWVACSLLRLSNDLHTYLVCYSGPQLWGVRCEGSFGTDLWQFRDLRVYVDPFSLSSLPLLCTFYTHIYIHTHTHTQARVHIYMNILTHTCIHMYIHTYIRTYMYKYTYIHIHHIVCTHMYVYRQPSINKPVKYSTESQLRGATSLERHPFAFILPTTEAISIYVYICFEVHKRTRACLQPPLDHLWQMKTDEVRQSKRVCKSHIRMRHVAHMNKCHVTHTDE